MANTPFLDLVKPAGTDHALVSVINSNSDKIDGGVSTLSEQIANLQIIPLTSSEGIKTVAMDNNRCPANTVRWFNLRLSDSSELPGAGQVYSVARVTKRVNSTCFIETFDDGGSIWRTSYDGSSWSAWQQLAMKSETAKIIVLSDAITFTNNANEAFGFSTYKDCYLLAVYTNSGATSVLGDDHVTTWNFNKSTGVLTITKTSSGAWNGSKGDVVFIRPNS